MPENGQVPLIYVKKKKKWKSYSYFQLQASELKVSSRQETKIND